MTPRCLSPCSTASSTVGTREFTYVRAGHELPILLNAAGEQEHVPVAPGQPLGIFLDPLLDEGTLTIPKGGKLILTTDGVTDARNQADEPFGEARFMQVIRDGWHLPAQELCDRILAAVTEYQGDAPSFDDFTLMVVQAELAYCFIRHCSGGSCAL